MDNFLYLLLLKLLMAPRSQNRWSCAMSGPLIEKYGFCAEQTLTSTRPHTPSKRAHTHTHTHTLTPAHGHTPEYTHQHMARHRRTHTHVARGHAPWRTTICARQLERNWCQEAQCQSRGCVPRGPQSEQKTHGGSAAHSGSLN